MIPDFILTHIEWVVTSLGIIFFVWFTQWNKRIYKNHVNIYWDDIYEYDLMAHKWNPKKGKENYVKVIKAFIELPNRSVFFYGFPSSIIYFIIKISLSPIRAMPDSLNFGQLYT